MSVNKGENNMATNNTKNKWVTVGSVLKRKDGSGTYVKLTKDVKAGTILNVRDPRDRLSDEQKAALESTGEVRVTTPSGKSYMVYNSVQFDLSMTE